MTFKDYTHINWHDKQYATCPTCDCPLRPDIYNCSTAVDTPVLRCPKCNILVKYSPISYFIRSNKAQLKYTSKYDTRYDNLVLEALKEEGM